MKTETVRPETGVKPEKAQEQKSAEPRQKNPMLFWTRLHALLLTLVLVLLLATVAVLGREIGSLHRSLDLMEQKLTEVQMEQVNDAIEAMTDAANQLASIDAEGLNRTAESLRQAADRLTAMDVKTLNEAIASLRDAADTLKQFDVEAFNDVIQSLDKTSENLAKITGGIGSVFGR